MRREDAIAQGWLDAHWFLRQYGVTAREDLRPEAWVYDNGIDVIERDEHASTSGHRGSEREGRGFWAPRCAHDRGCDGDPLSLLRPSKYERAPSPRASSRTKRTAA